SSRRRHTRSKRDWSSDVCSSDLRYIQIQGNLFQGPLAGIPCACLRNLQEEPEHQVDSRILGSPVPGYKEQYPAGHLLYEEGHQGDEEAHRIELPEIPR